MEGVWGRRSPMRPRIFRDECLTRILPLTICGRQKMRAGRRCQNPLGVPRAISCSDEAGREIRSLRIL